MDVAVRALVARCLRGEQGAMIELVDRYQGHVFGLCYRMLRNRHDAEDAAQDTFVRVFRNLHRFDTRRDFRPWLLAIAGNRCRTVLARRQRQPPVVGIFDDLPDPRPDEQGERNLAEEVRRSLGLIREEYREAFLLFHQHQLSYGEISQVLDCPLGTVKTWVHRARRELTRELRRRGVAGDLRNEML